MTAARDELLGKLHPEGDPFAGFDPTGWADPTDEWDSHHAYFDEAVAVLQPRVIVEVGSFLGVSSRHFAAALQRDALDAVVVCCDTWLAETVLWSHPRWRAHLRHTHGRPETYKVWMANAVAAELEEYLCPLPMDSRGAARHLAALGVTADVLYIDGSHEPGDVYQDLALYWPLLRRGGWLLADDYAALFPGVMADVDRFAAERGVAVDVRGIKARLRKG